MRTYIKGTKKKQEEYAHKECNEWGCFYSCTEIPIGLQDSHHRQVSEINEKTFSHLIKTNL